jgi:radical SAM superfamily enzyme YgiQ (UPF0313 family)
LITEDNKIKVLVVSTNRTAQPVIVMPFGPALVAEAVRKAGHEVSFIDLMLYNNFQGELIRRLEAFDPDVVGLSIRNIDNNDMKNARALTADAVNIAEMIIRRSRARLVLGGAAVSIMPYELLHLTGARIACVGRGEKVMPEILEKIQNEEGFENVEGAAWMDGKIFHINREKIAGGTRNASHPDVTAWMDLKFYTGRMATYPIQTKTDCPFDCIYCTYPITESKNYLLDRPKNVVEAVKALCKKGVKDFEFVDNVFNSPYEHAMDLCEEITLSGLRARFHAVSLNPAYIDKELIGAMSKANFKSAGITAESASDDMLRNLGKQYGRKDLINSAQAVAEGNIPCLWMFMLGGPGETKQTVNETLEFAQKYIKPSDTAFFNVGIRVYPGTEIGKLAKEEKLFDDETFTALKPQFYFSRQLDRGWLTEKLGDAKERNLNFIDSDSLSFPHLTDLNRLGRSLGFTPPLWKNARFLRRSLRAVGLQA